MNKDLTLSRLQDSGHRLTKARVTMVEIFSGKHRPLTVHEIEAKLKTMKVAANKSTVYRELQFMIDEGLISEVYIDPQQTAYESAELPHHHHLVCEKCGAVECVTNCLAENFEAEVYKKKGFKIKRHMLEFYGTCEECLKNA